MIASCAFVKWVKLALKGALLLPCASHGLGYGYGLASSALLWFLALMHVSFNVVFLSCLYVVVFTFQVCQANISRTMCARACLIEHVGGQWCS